jgi:acyl CoA:acetate/3-ketoacid CoA transferase
VGRHQLPHGAAQLPYLLPPPAFVRVAHHVSNTCGLVGLRPGVGTPEGVAVMAATHAAQNPVARSCRMTTEAGAYGGSPGGGLLFGAAFNPTALLPSATMLDWYYAPLSFAVVAVG